MSPAISVTDFMILEARSTILIKYDFKDIEVIMITLRNIPIQKNIDNNGKIDSFSKFSTSELIMLEKDVNYTKEVYVRLLKEFEKNHLKKEKEPVTGHIPILEQVGGDMILGAIFE